MLGFTTLIAAGFSEVFFESPGLMIAGLAVVWAVMRVVGRRSGNKNLLRGSWVPLGLIVALLLTSMLVTTEREEIADAVDELILAVETEDIAALEKRILPQAMTNFLSREHTRDEVVSLLERTKVEDLTLLSSSVKIDDNNVGSSLIRVRSKGEAGGIPGIMVSEWAIRWRYEDGAWRALRIECDKMGADAMFNRE